jgi:RimJ/RimL family protein N-acetyltransferase
METERLVLRLYSEADKENLMQLFTDEAVMKHVDTGGFSREKAEELWLKLREDFYPKGLTTIYGVFDKTDEHYIGHASIRPRPTNPNEWEIGYILKVDEWGKGYATEIGRKLVEFGFNELNLTSVFATVDTNNYASIHVLEKIGMKHIRDEYDEQGRFFVYGILWSEQRAVISNW